jgi:hypothetical protein
MEIRQYHLQHYKWYSLVLCKQPGMINPAASDGFATLQSNSQIKKVGTDARDYLIFSKIYA